MKTRKCFIVLEIHPEIRAAHATVIRYLVFVRICGKQGSPNGHIALETPPKTHMSGNDGSTTPDTSVEEYKSRLLSLIYKLTFIGNFKQLPRSSVFLHRQCSGAVGPDLIKLPS